MGDIAGSGSTYLVEYLPNYGIKPESSKGWEVGADLYYNGFSLGLTYFVTDYTDHIQTIELRPRPNRLRQKQNLPGITEYRGLEVFTDWEMGDTFGWNFDLKPYVSLTKMFRYHNEGTVMGYVSDLTVSYGLIFNHPDTGLVASIDAVYYGMQHAHLLGRAPETPFGGDTVLDLSLAKRIHEWEDAGRLIVKLDIENLTDHFYWTREDQAQPGRSFLVSLKYEF